MHKETVIAILIGLSLGLLMTYGVYRFRRSQVNSKTADLNQIAQQSPPEEKLDTIMLDSPEDGVVQAEDSIEVSGTTLPNSFVILFVGNNESITTTDETGAFSFQSALKDGPNILTVTVADNDGQTTSVRRLVVVDDGRETTNAANKVDNSKDSSDER